MMRSTAPSSVTTNDAMPVGAPRLTSHSCSGANNTASTGIPMIPVAYGPRDHRIATPSAMTMNAARWCLVSKNAKLFAAFHPQHARQRRAIDGERDEIVAGRDLIRPAAESAEPAAAGRATERLRDEPEGAKATTAATAPASPRFSEQIAERGEETRVGLIVARLAAAFTARCRQTRRIRHRARRRLARPLDEATGPPKGRAPPPPAATTTAPAAGVGAPGRTTTRRAPVRGAPPPPRPPPPPPPPNPKRCAIPCTSPASSSFLIGSSCSALPPAFCIESNTTLIRCTSHALSRFCDGESATGGGFRPWKFQTTRCRPALAGP